MPFDALLFVASVGNGDLFGYAVLNGTIQRDDIYVWDHEDDSRTWVASSLKDFIKGSAQMIAKPFPSYTVLSVE